MDVHKPTTKRIHNDSFSGSPIKRQRQVKWKDIKVLLPTGHSIELNEERDKELTVEEFIRKVKRRVPPAEAEKIQWGPHVTLEDSMGNPVRNGEIFCSDDISTSVRTLVLQDGQPNATHVLEDMWNVTPDPKLLGALPQEYTLETALADIIDNSLQAIWANAADEKRLISLHLKKDKITIFDSGQGMDSTIENSIAKWGTMGLSKHQQERMLAIGGTPPFLKPYFGMYGFGGLVAAMHLGSVAIVSSKTKSSKKVVSLTLEKEKLMERCKKHRTWMTPGEFREPTDEERTKSPHGSFTKIELSNLKKKVWREHQVKCMLKDVYFPYIQCDISDSCTRTSTPVLFEVNGTNLAEVEGGEVAVTNMFSSNGSPFIFDLHLSKLNEDINWDSETSKVEYGNARVTCFYYPIQLGKETIDLILEELQNQSIGINESFESFCRVSIRRLGRLLPDARWKKLPFMEPKRRRADKEVVHKSCFERVKAFVDTDAGFVPTTSKLDLSGSHPFTNALKNLGSRGTTQYGVELNITREGKSINAVMLEKEYEEWVREMHLGFDEEVDCERENEREAVIITSNMPELGFIQGVFRVSEIIRRKGVVWKKDMRVKFHKCYPGLTNKDVFATLEYFLVEGLTEDRGNSKVVCRPMEVLEDEGSCLSTKNGSPLFNVGRSRVLPIELLSSEKCVIVNEEEWMRCDERRLMRCPSRIDILDEYSTDVLGVHVGFERTVKAGSDPPHEIYAVVRPLNYVRNTDEGRQINTIDQKGIIKRMMQMSLEIKGTDDAVGFTLFSTVKTLNNIQGIHCFSTIGSKLGSFYRKAGRYCFLFSLEDDECVERKIEETIEVDVLPSDKLGRWDAKLSGLEGYGTGRAKNIANCRIGSQIGPVLLHCYDEFDNAKTINNINNLKSEIWSGDQVLDVSLRMEGLLSVNYDRSVLIKAIQLVKGSLAGISADNAGLLKFLIAGEVVASINVYVLPGQMSSVQMVESQRLDNHLRTGDTIHLLTLQVLDDYGNHVEKGARIIMKMVGLELQDSEGDIRVVDDRGCIRLGGLLKVTSPLNSTATLCVYSEGMKLLYEKKFSLLRRSLCIASEIPEECNGGQKLKDIKIEVVDVNGDVDHKMNGPGHMIILDVPAAQNAYPLKDGYCCIREILLPNIPGPWLCRIYHALFDSLEAYIKLNIVSYSPIALETHALEYDVHNEALLMLHDIDGVKSEENVMQGNRNRRERELTEMVEKLIENLRALRQDFMKCVGKVKRAEEELNTLNEKKELNREKLSKLEGEIKLLEQKLLKVDTGKVRPSGSYLVNDGCSGVATVAKCILGTYSAARFVMEAQSPGMFLSPESNNVNTLDMLGVVALLASVDKPSLANAMAGFVGIDNMLAVVCKTRAAANLLMRFNEVNGSIDKTWGLYRFLETQNQRMKVKLRVYILEELKCYSGGYEHSHPQKLLRIAEPKLKSGVCPSGFLGYAVNLLQLCDEHLVHSQSLRGGLFYSIFKEVQVYETRQKLLAARDALTCGGISLDGSYIHDEGCEEYHASWNEGMVTFPVVRKPQIFQASVYQQFQMEEILRVKKKECEEQKNILNGGMDDRVEYVTRKLARNKERFREITQQIELEKSRLESLQSAMHSFTHKQEASCAGKDSVDTRQF